MCRQNKSIINQTPSSLTPAPRTAAAARLVHESVDAECDQCEHEEEDDDYYRYHVVFLDHFCGFFALSFSNRDACCGLWSRGGEVKCGAVSEDVRCGSDAR